MIECFKLLLIGFKVLGAGIATIGLGAGAIGAAIVFSALITGTARNPSLKGELFSLAILAFSLTEALALFALMIIMLILFAF